jgi:hypothetical protein
MVFSQLPNFGLCISEIRGQGSPVKSLRGPSSEIPRAMTRWSATNTRSQCRRRPAFGPLEARDPSEASAQAPPRLAGVLNASPVPQLIVSLGWKAQGELAVTGSRTALTPPRGTERNLSRTKVFGRFELYLPTRPRDNGAVEVKAIGAAFVGRITFGDHGSIG